MGKKGSKKNKKVYKIFKKCNKKIMPFGPLDGDRPAFWRKGRLKEAGNTEEGREFQKWEVEGKKPSLNRLILALESSTQ